MRKRVRWFRRFEPPCVGHCKSMRWRIDGCTGFPAPPVSASLCVHMVSSIRTYVCVLVNTISCVSPPDHCEFDSKLQPKEVALKHKKKRQNNRKERENRSDCSLRHEFVCSTDLPLHLLISFLSSLSFLLFLFFCLRRPRE